MNKPIYIIAAVGNGNALGKNGRMPWNLKKEMRHFTETTTRVKDPVKQNMVVMGRTTWESIPLEHRPLPGRVNVVLSGNPDYQASGAATAGSLDAAYAMADDTIESIFIMGGGKVYAQAMTRGDTTGVYLTRIYKDFECDTYFPNIPDRFRPISLGKDKEAAIEFEYFLYE
jgi:dihydrofolate reductase